MTWHTRTDADWPPIAPEAVMAAELSDRFHHKQGRSIVRWSLGDNTLSLVVYLKRHHVGPWWSNLMARLTRKPGWSAAWREFTHLVWAGEHGFRVPRAVAVGESAGPTGLRSFLAVEELTGMIGLHEAIPLAAARLTSAEFSRWKSGLIHELARTVRRLHGLRHFHKDLYLCHFYIRETDCQSPPEDWAGRVAMIDLHRLGRHTLTARWWQAKDLAQLAYSSEVAGVTPRDRLRFWRAYVEAGSSEWLRRAVQVRWTNYRARAARRSRRANRHLS